MRVLLDRWGGLGVVNEDAESRQKTDPITNLRMDPGSGGRVPRQLSRRADGSGEDAGIPDGGAQ